METTAQSPYMSPKEAAEFLRVSVDTLTRYSVQRKWKRFFLPSGYVRYLRLDVESALKEAK